MGSILELSPPHTLEQIDIFFNRTVSVGALFSGIGQGAAVIPNLFCAQAVNICPAFFDELHGILVELFKIVRGIQLTISPIKSEPLDI